MTVKLRLTFDASADVAYLYLRPTGPDEVLGPTLLLLERDPDFEGVVGLDFLPADGRAVGLEFQKASASLPAELLAVAERRDGWNLVDRMDERFRGVPPAPGRGRRPRH